MKPTESTSLADYIAVVRRRSTVVALLAVTGALIGVALAYATTEKAVATAKIYVSFDPQTEFEIQNAQVISFVALADDPALLQSVVEELNLDIGVPELEDQIDVQQEPGGNLIDITAGAARPTTAAAIADTFAVRLASTINSLLASDDPERPDRGVPRAEVLDRGSTPASMQETPLVRSAGFGLVAGLFLGIAAALIAPILDTRVRGVQALGSHLDLPILGEIAYERGLQATPRRGPTGSPRSGRTNGQLDFGQTPAVEDLRHVRTNLLARISNDSADAPGIVVVSALPREGRTTLAFNLTRSLAVAGNSVALVDADLRTPAIHSRFGFDRSPGLAEVLHGDVSIAASLKRNGSAAILPAGSETVDATEILASDALSTVLKELAQEFELVLIDAPPSLPYADATALSLCAGSAILVARYGYSRWQEVERCAAILRSTHTRLAGTVVTMTPSPSLGGRVAGAWQRRSLK